MGSKRKQARQKKPRTTVHSVKFADGTRLDRVEVNVDTGEITHSFEGKVVMPSEATLEVTYPRDKGPKVLVRTPVTGAAVWACPDSVDRLIMQS